MRDLTLAEIAGMRRADAEIAIRSRVQTVYLGNEEVVTRILGHPKMFLSTTDTGFGCHVMLDGFWEMWLTQFFCRTIKPGMTVVDVGANFGYYSILFGIAVGPRGRVVAVEPVSSTARLLRRSIHLNGHDGKTRVAECALGREPYGRVHVVIPNGEPKNATVVARPRPGSVEVETTSLDALVQDLDRVDLVKIDAEGAEADIVAGMQTTLERHRPNVLLEFNARRYADAPAFVAELQRWFHPISELDFNGELKVIGARELIEDGSGEDRLLYLVRRP